MLQFEEVQFREWQQRGLPSWSQLALRLAAMRLKPSAPPQDGKYDGQRQRSTLRRLLPVVIVTVEFLALW